MGREETTAMQAGSGGDEVPESDTRCHQEGQDDERRGAKGCWCGADER